MKILIVDDNLKPLEGFIKKLEIEHDVKLFDDSDSVKNYNANAIVNFNIAFIDLDLSGSTHPEKRNDDGYLVAKYLKEKNENIVCILLTGESPNIEDIFNRDYIDDYLDKQHRGNSIIVETMIKRWSRQIKLAEENSCLKETVKEYEAIYNQNQGIAEEKGLFTQSLVINGLIDKLRIFCKRGFDGDILLIGESGTGKELFAEIIHEVSDRKNIPLKIVNMSDFNSSDSNLAHSEVFGHIKGAYTGAHQDREGAISIADKGIIFFDELHNSGLDFQNKLLRFIAKKEYSQLGSDKIKKADVKVIASFNEDIEKLYSEKRLKKDLIERFLFPINIPNLRERGRNEFNYVVEKIISKENSEKSISKDALDLLWGLNYKDSNLRKLHHILKLTINLMNGSVINTDNLQLRKEDKTPSSFNSQQIVISEKIQGRINLLNKIEESVSKLNKGKKVNVKDVEVDISIMNLSAKFSNRTNKKQAEDYKMIIENNLVDCTNSKKYFSPIITLLEKK